MEEKNSIELKFRNGDDLFNNYSIGIIRQVVDKSESTIQQKREEMRQLVGGKYLEMLNVSDTITEMNKEFSNISSSVNQIISICNELGEDYLFVDDKEDSAEEITPDSLWAKYDRSEMLLLAIDLREFNSKEESKYSSLYSEFKTVFPQFAAQQCVNLLLSDFSLSPSRQMELFTAYFLLVSSSPESSPVSTLSSFLHNAESPITSELRSPSLDSLLRSIRYVHTALRSVISFLQATEFYDIFSSHFPSLSVSWRQDHQDALRSLLQTWTQAQITNVTSAASTVVAEIQTISSLAEMKRQTSALLDSIAPEWHATQAFLALSDDLFRQMFDSLFQKQSEGLIVQCFEMMRSRMEGVIEKMGEWVLEKCEETINQSIAQPIFDVFIDLTELDFAVSNVLKDIVEKETQKLFGFLYQSIYQMNVSSTLSHLMIAYTSFIMENTFSSISLKYSIQESSVVHDFQQCFTSHINSWVKDSLTIESAIHAYMTSLNWTMRDHQWLESLSGWREFSLSEGEGQDDSVFVPGVCSPVLTDVLLHVCHLLDDVNTISSAADFLSKCRKETLCCAYQCITSHYKTELEAVLKAHPMIASPGLLILLFDIRFLRKLVASLTASDIDERMEQMEAVVMEEVDPVDWTLAESYMEMALNDFISSMALLISPLLPEGYEMQNNVTVKSLTRNTNVLFTPVEKFASYPMSSQPMQLLLQSYLKGM